jgi:uncharacterized membrane protein
MNLMSLIILYHVVNRDLSMNKVIFVFLGIFFAGIGVFMPKLKQNYFAGFRLPWTLDNENNWIETHKLAGKFWVAGGAAQIVTALVFDGKILFIIFFGITMVMVIVPVIFSYKMFRQTVNKNQA